MSEYTLDETLALCDCHKLTEIAHELKHEPSPEDYWDIIQRAHIHLARLHQTLLKINAKGD